MTTDQTRKVTFVTTVSGTPVIATKWNDRDVCTEEENWDHGDIGRVAMGAEAILPKAKAKGDTAENGECPACDGSGTVFIDGEAGAVNASPCSRCASARGDPGKATAAADEAIDPESLFRDFLQGMSAAIDAAIMDVLTGKTPCNGEPAGEVHPFARRYRSIEEAEQAYGDWLARHQETAAAHAAFAEWRERHGQGADHE